MSNKGVKVQVELDFTSGRIDKEEINRQIDTAIDAVKINLDPQSAKEFEQELQQLGGMLQKSLNQVTGKIDAKSLVANIDNTENFDMIEKLGARYKAVGVDGTESFAKISKETDFLNEKLIKSNSSLTKMGDTLQNTIRWTISSAVVREVTAEFQKMFYFAKDLDRTLNDIRIVTGKSKEEMEGFAVAANKAAIDLKVSTIEYGNAATLFFQQGFDEKQVKDMTEAAVMASRITGTAAIDMSDLLTSTLNGFGMATDEIKDITDKFAAVGADTASDFEELSIAMSKVASIGNTAGVTIDQLTGQVATIVSVTREAPETVGTALKTVYGRMLNFKEDKDALIQDDDGQIFGVKDVEKALKDFSKAADANIELFETTADGKREMRDLGDVIEDIGAAWDNTSDKTVKFALTTALAGSRQQNHIIALLDNWNMYESAVTTSLNSEGETLKQNEIYMDSYEAKVKELQAEKERLYMEFTDMDSMKGLVEGATSLLSTFTDLIEKIDVIALGIGIVGSVFSEKIVNKAIEFRDMAVAFGNSAPQIASDLGGPSDEQVDIMNNLRTINKAYGNEKANQMQKEIRGLKQKAEEYGVISDEINEELVLLKAINDISKKDEEIEQVNLLMTEQIKSMNMDKEQVKSAQELQAAYVQILELSKQRAAIEQQIQDGDATPALLDALDATKIEIANLDLEVEAINKMSENAAIKAYKAREVASADLERSVTLLNEQAEAAQKAQMATQAFSGAMMTLPGVVSNVKSETSDLKEKLSGIAKSTIPSIIAGLTQSLPAFSAAIIAGKGLAAALGAAGAAFLPFVAGAAIIAGIGMAVAALTHEVDHAAVALEKINEISEEIDESNQVLQKSEAELSKIEERLKEIKKLKEDGTELSKQELKDLEEEESALSRKKELQEIIIKQEEKKLELLEDQKAEIAKEELEREKEFEGIGHYDGYGFVADTGPTLEGLKAYKKEINNSREEIEKYEISLLEMNYTQSQLNKAFKDGGDAADESLDEYAKMKHELEDLKKHAENFIEAATLDVESLDTSSEKHVDYFNKIMEAIIEATNALYDFNEAELETLETPFDDEDNERMEESTDILERLAAEYYGLVSSADDDGVFSDRLWEEYETLLMLERELTEEGEISYESYLKLLDISEDFIGGMELEQGALLDLMRSHSEKTASVIEEAIEQERVVRESTQAQIGHYADAVSASAIASGAASNYGGYGGAYVPMNAHALEKYNKEQEEREGALLRAEKLDAKMKAIQERARPKRGGGQKRGSSGVSRQKEEYKAEADRYEGINFLLDRNSKQLSLNTTLRKNAEEGSKAYNDSIDREIALQRQRQNLLSKEAEAKRAEGRELEKSLSGIFNFVGSWDDNTRTITNLGAIQGQSKEVEEQFKRVMTIMQDLPNGSEEWWKINQAIKDLELEKMESTMQGIRDLTKQEDDKNLDLEFSFHMGDVDDFSNIMRKKIGEWKNASDTLKAYQASLDNLNKKTYPEGSKQHLKQIEDRKELEELIKKQTIAVVKHRIEVEKEIEAEKERIKQLEVDRRQKEVESAEQVQDVIVEIIRKRGEEEQRILDENYNKDMERLRKEREARQRRYNEDLDAYRKLINDKIAALDEAYAEEDYREQLKKEQEEANRLQREIDILSLDDSLTANNKRADLREKLAEQIEKIEKMEQKRSRDATKKALRDELKDYEEQAKNKDDIDQDNHDNRMDLLKEEYERNKKALEDQYSNAKVHTEARESMMRGTVEVAKGVYKDIATAHADFQDEFGAGMGVLGNIIKEEFLEPLREAQHLMSITPGGFIERPPQSTDDIPDSQLKDLGYVDPEKPNFSNSFSNRPQEFISPKTWSESDYNTYIENKKKWDNATSASEKQRYGQANKNLRVKYWGKSRENEDYYHWTDLVNMRGYKDGGVMDETSIFKGHGSEQSAEVIFSAKTAKKLWEYVENMPKISDLKTPQPNKNTSINMAGNKYEIKFDVQGNLDRSLLPEIKDMMESAIEDSEFNKIKQLKKTGQFRPI